MSIREANTREIAEAIGVTKGAVFGWAERREENDMPRPIRYDKRHGGGNPSPIYDLDAVLAWHAEFTKGPDIPEDWLSTKEAGALVGIHESTINEFIRERPDFPRPQRFRSKYGKFERVRLNKWELIEWKENVYVPGEKGKTVISTDMMPENLEYDPQATRMFLTMPFMSLALKQEFPEIEDFA